MAKFKVGDRVRVDSGYTAFKRIAGKEGTVCRIGGTTIGIRFDESFDGGHDCSGACTHGYGRNINENYLRLVNTTATTASAGATVQNGKKKKIVKQPSYKVGDVVKIRENIVNGKGGYKHHTGGTNSVAAGMYQYKGTEHKIRNDGQNGYYLEGATDLQWTDEMIEGKVEICNLEVGDRVRATQDFEGKHIEGRVGTICNVRYEDIMGVKFDDNISGHDCSGACTYGYGWNVSTRYLQYIGASKSDLATKEVAKGIKLVEATEKKEEPKFKVGDFIRGTKESDGKYSYTNSEMTKGKVVNVSTSGKLITVQMIEHKRGDSGTLEVDPKYFELVDAPAKVAPLPATKDYKVGDRVIVKDVKLEPDAIDNRSIIGKTATIKRIDMYGSELLYTLEFDEKIGGHACTFGGKAYAKDGYGWNVRKHQIAGLADEKKPVKLTESAPKAEIKPEVKKEGVKPMPKYKIGDRVKLQCSWKPRYEYGAVKQGDEGVIVKIQDLNGRGNQVAYKVDFPNQSFWTGCEDELVPVVEAAKKGIKLVATETVVPGITIKAPVAEVVDYEYDFEEEFIEEEYEEEDYEGPFSLVELTPYEPCTLGTIDFESLTRRDTMAAGITLRETGAIVAESPARGIFPATSKTERKTGGIMKAFGNIFGSNIGKDNSGRLALTIAGIAVKNNEGKFVAYKDGALVDVMDAKFDVDNAFYRIPTTDVKKDDIIINQSGVPVIVIKVETDGLTVVNPYNGLQEKIVPSTNLLNMKFYVKVISLFGDMFKGIDLSNPQSVLPFVLMSEGGSEDMLPLMLMAGGSKDMNSMLPLLLMSGKGGDMGDMLPFLLMGQNGGDMSAMLPLLLLGKGGKGDMMETMLMMQAFGGKGFNLFGAPAAAPADAE